MKYALYYVLTWLKKHDIICDVCNRLAKKYSVKFVYEDFRTLFWQGQHKAKELGLYRQKYCGCIFSIDEGGGKKWKTHKVYH